MAQDNKDSNETPEHLPPAGASAEESLRNLHSDHDEELLGKLQEYARPLILGVTLALLVFFGIQYMRWQRADAARSAAEMYAQAQSAETFEQVAREFPKTSEAPRALLRAAALHFRDGQFERAEQVYRGFIAQYPEHIMRPSAEVGIAFCLEASNRWSEGEEEFARFVAAHPAHFQVPLARFGRARCLAQLGRFDEARAVHEDFIAAEPESVWREEAEVALQLLKLQEKSPLDLSAAAAPARPAQGIPPFLQTPWQDAPPTMPPQEPAPETPAPIEEDAAETETAPEQAAEPAEEAELGQQP